MSIIDGGFSQEVFPDLVVPLHDAEASVDRSLFERESQQFDQDRAKELAKLSKKWDGILKNRHSLPADRPDYFCADDALRDSAYDWSPIADEGGDIVSDYAGHTVYVQDTSASFPTDFFDKPSTKTLRGSVFGNEPTRSIFPVAPSSPEVDLWANGRFGGTDTYTDGSTEDTVVGWLVEEIIDEALSELTEKEEKVIRLRFGLDDGIVRTLEQVGVEFRLTRERIRVIEAKALAKLRHPNFPSWENNRLRELVDPPYWVPYRYREPVEKPTVSELPITRVTMNDARQKTDPNLIKRRVTQVLYGVRDVISERILSFSDPAFVEELTGLLFEDSALRYAKIRTRYNNGYLLPFERVSEEFTAQDEALYGKEAFEVKVALMSQALKRYQANVEPRYYDPRFIARKIFNQILSKQIKVEPKDESGTETASVA